MTVPVDAQRKRCRLVAISVLVLAASAGASRAIDGPGLGNLSYAGAELFEDISLIVSPADSQFKLRNRSVADSQFKLRNRSVR